MAPQDWKAYSFRAMGSEIVLWLDTDEREVFRQGEEMFLQAERRLSRFRADSELSQLNRHSGEWTQVSPLLYQIADTALRLAEETGGLFDPTLLHALEQAGYDRSFERLHEGGQRSAHYAPAAGRWDGVRVDKDRQAIRLPHGAALDLGGIAKSYVAQQVCGFLRPMGPCLVDAGGDIIAGDAPRGLPGWPVAIAMPGSAEEDSEDGLTLWLANSALATSGVDYRHWVYDGMAQHHIIDPRTGLPAESDLLTATVLAEDASTADAWATACLIYGETAGALALTTHPLAGVMMRSQRRAVITQKMLPYITWQSPTLKMSVLLQDMNQSYGSESRSTT